MATITVSTTGIGPGPDGNPTECHDVDTVEVRRYFEPNADVAIIRGDISQLLAVAYDILYQAVDQGVLAGWNTQFPERVDA